MKAKAKKCTCCQLHNSTNESSLISRCNTRAKKAVQKTKWITKDSGECENQTYRITFESYPEDYQSIRDEVEAYGSMIKEEKEVIDNG